MTQLKGAPLFLLVLMIIFCNVNSAKAANFRETFNDSSSAPRYSFDAYKFGDTGIPWEISGLEQGGINDSGCVRVRAVNRDQDDCWYGLEFDDGDFYWRGCWKFSNDWVDSGLVDQKLTYIYGTGGNLNLFWHSGGDWPPGTWSKQGMELAHYAVTGDWVPANSAENERRHTNYLLLAEHFDRWICVEHHVDVNQSPWTHTYWVTTQGGVALAPGTCARVDGRTEFNDYEYIRTRLDASPASYTFIKFGAFINENAGTGYMYLDEFVMSDSKIGHPFGGGGSGGPGQEDSVSPSAPVGLRIVQSE